MWITDRISVTTTKIHHLLTIQYSCNISGSLYKSNYIYLLNVCRRFKAICTKLALHQTKRLQQQFIPGISPASTWMEHVRRMMPDTELFRFIRIAVYATFAIECIERRPGIPEIESPPPSRWGLLIRPCLPSRFMYFSRLPTANHYHLSLNIIWY